MNEVENQNIESVNWKVPEVKEKESKINIGEIYFDHKLEDIFEKEEFEAEIQKINKEIEEYLGENKSSATYDFRIYSNRKEYEDYFETNFPEKHENFMKNDMAFYYDENNNKNVIAKYMELISEPLDPNNHIVQAYAGRRNIKLENINPKELKKQNYKENIYPTMAHEMTHAHPFFKGVHYREMGNKWAQEMVSVFIDQKKWEKIPEVKEKMESNAREQAQNKDFYKEIIKSIEKDDSQTEEERFMIENWERYFYPFLEKRHGKEKLIKFWTKLQQKVNIKKFEDCFEEVFEEKLKDTAGLFQKESIFQKQTDEKLTEKKETKNRELTELTDEERSQFGKAVNILTTNLPPNTDTKFSKINAIETIKKLQVKEGREILIHYGFNDPDLYIQTEVANALGAIGLPQDIEAIQSKLEEVMTLPHSKKTLKKRLSNFYKDVFNLSYCEPFVGTKTVLRMDLRRAIEKIKDRFDLKE